MWAVRLYAMCMGLVEVDVAKFMPDEPERGERYLGPAMAFLYQTEDGANVLVDTGLAPDHIDDPEARMPRPDIVVTMRPEHSIVEQLRLVGVEASDVDAVVNTHLDFDHCGGNAFFPRARFFVQREQYDYAKATPERCPPPDWDLEDLHYELLDGDRELYPGVRVVVTPGHAPGHQSVVVSLPRTGTVILAADAAHTHVMFEEERVAGALDPAAALASIRKLKRIRDADNATVLVCHDVEAWQSTYRRAPDYYD
jgi:N-acyl homoserine lactone hydrolase